MLNAKNKFIKYGVKIARPTTMDMAAVVKTMPAATSLAILASLANLLVIRSVIDSSEVLIISATTTKVIVNNKIIISIFVTSSKIAVKKTVSAANMCTRKFGWDLKQ